MRIAFGSTDTGRMRKVNQDDFACGSVSDNMVYGILCDGMGGENGGGVASALAVKVAQEALDRELEDTMNEASIRSVMMSAVAGANAVVYDTAQKNPALSGMGTTMIVAVILGDTLYVSCVGDSRAYLASPQGERQITRDHTVVQMLLDIGEISEQDAKSHPKRHYITRAVGVSPSVDADFLVETLGDGEMVLLCSDGLYNYLLPDSLYGLLRECAEKKSADSLIVLANTGGGADNITALVMA